jgi:hypothetical protein
MIFKLNVWRFALYEEAAAEDRETIIRAAGPARLAAECYRRACRDVPGLDAPGLSGMSAKERRKRLLEIQGGAAEAARILEWFIAASEHSAEMFGLALAFEAERERDRLPKARIRKMERTLEENRAAARGAENVLWRLEGVIGLAKEALGSAK